MRPTCKSLPYILLAELGLLETIKGFFFFQDIFQYHLNPLLPMRMNSSCKLDGIGYALLMVELF